MSNRPRDSGRDGPVVAMGKKAFWAYAVIVLGVGFALAFGSQLLWSAHRLTAFEWAIVAVDAVIVFVRGVLAWREDQRASESRVREGRPKGEVDRAPPARVWGRAARWALSDAIALIVVFGIVRSTIGSIREIVAFVRRESTPRLLGWFALSAVSLAYLGWRWRERE
jgi:hypothetical protein